MSTDDRSWMDNRRLPNQKGITDEFRRGLKNFIDFATSNPRYMSGEQIRCPCVKCHNRLFQHIIVAQKHLLQHGFQHGYKRWIAHGEQVIVGTNINNDPQKNQVPETEPELPDAEAQTMIVEEVTVQGMEDMVRDAASPEFDLSRNTEQEPNTTSKKFVDVMDSAKEKLYSGCEITVSEAVTEFLNMKSECNLSEAAYNRLMKALKGLLPAGNKLVDNFNEAKKFVGQIGPTGNKLVNNFNEAKKFVGKIGLSYEKIDACKNDCMLFYKENSSKTECSVCGHSRYRPKRMVSSKHQKNVPHKQLCYMPLIPRLQCLYASKVTSEAMRWHKESPREKDMLIHPSDGEAWKHFDATYPDFAGEVRNIRLCICVNDFNHFGSRAISYYCLPVIVTVYNLPPWLCMSDPFMFLSLLIPGPKSPGKNIDIYLRPLMDELTMLWKDGVETWDAFKQENFDMRGALMWTVNDFPTSGILSGWSTDGKLACPYCMGDTKSFALEHSKKPCWFDCHRRFLQIDHPFRTERNLFRKNKEEHDEPPLHLSGEYVLQEVLRKPSNRWGKKFSKVRLRGYGTLHNWTKRSIFWELPYWKTNLIRHNLDVMHIEKNVFDNVFNTLMDFRGYTKDTARGRMDLKEICKRPALELVKVNGKTVKPVASYVLTKENRQNVLKWLESLRVPDGYASNISDCVDIEEGKIRGLKRHDCHMLFSRLLPIALRDLLHDNVWVALTELSESFRALSSTTLRVNDVKKLEESIVVTLCKLEKIFPPSFFDIMEHLPVHLAYEARVGGPVQYRWMYPFKRYLGGLKRKIKGTVKVFEASITEADIIDEIVALAGTYSHADVETRLTKVGHNYDGGEPNSNGGISVFSSPGRFLGEQVGMRMLTPKEFDAAKLYVLLNCPEVEDYLNMFEDEAGDDMSPELLASRTDNKFPSWLKKYISEHPDDDKVARLKELAADPDMEVNLYNGYVVNGYVFHTKSYGESKLTWNSGVSIKGNLQYDYIGVLKEVIELRYLGKNKVVLFNCDWRDVKQGIQKHDMFDLIDVKDSAKYTGDDVFILASQAQQVYITPYPHRRAEFSEWWAVWKTKARSTFDIPYQSNTTTESLSEECYQEDEMPVPPKVSSAVHPLDYAAHFLAQNVDEMEEVSPNDLPPPPPRPGYVGVIDGYTPLKEESDDSFSDSDELSSSDLEFDGAE